MEDLAQLDTGKRKRSPVDSLTNVPIPFLIHDSNEPQPGLPVHLDERLPLPKRPRLPEKPVVPGTEPGIASGLMSLPPGVLQTVFLYLDPPSLGRFIRVSRTFRDLLDSRRPLPPDQMVHFTHNGRGYETNSSSLSSQDLAWQASRRRHVPSMPQPMEGLPECELFALSFGITCQFCGALPTPIVLSPGKRRTMPIEYSVRVIWPFKVRACMQCLTPRLKKVTFSPRLIMVLCTDRYQQDFDVMMSDASPLRPALSFAFFTAGDHLQYVPQSRWRRSVLHDTDLQKYYYAPEIEVLQEEAKSVQGLGQGAAEEWIKGLPARGQVIQDFAAKWEDWELTGGLEEARRLLFQRTETSRGFPMFHHSSLRPEVPGLPSAPGTSIPLPNTLPSMPLQSHGLAPGMEAPVGLPPKPSDASSMSSQTSSTRTKTAPSSSELSKMRAQKRGLIIEKCRALNPPIHKEMLDRLDAYYNALQVPLPLNESSWETLKSLLLTQREQVNLQDEARNSVTTAPTPGQFIPPFRTDEYVLAHADTPMKEKLCEIAREYIKQRFGHGGWVTYPTAPQFAAEVLTHTRKTYFQEKDRIKALRSHDLNAPQDEILRYEHMKWVFEQTIRPQTEQIRKELFLCVRCPAVSPLKYFTLEGMIQHFCYKHDPSFTAERPIGFWRSEWPEVPPFEPHPERVRTTPEPSIADTATLSHQPPPITSPSFHTMIPPGRRTPDTMSLLSGNTNPFSASGRSARKSSQATKSAAPVIYELQRDSLATELSRGWKLARSAPEMPLSLQVYLTLGFAIASLSRKYKNEPSLNMLEDCIGTKADLDELKNLEPFRCAECVLDGRDEVQVEWSLHDLTAHFRKMHIENSATKSYWKDNMISLPDPAFIKSILLNNGIPTVLHNLLQDAETTAVIQKATANPSKPQSFTQPAPIEDFRRARDGRPEPVMSMFSEGRQQYQSFGVFEGQYSYQRAHPISTAATYSELRSPSEAWPAPLRFVDRAEYPNLTSDRSILSSRAEFPPYSTAPVYTEAPRLTTDLHPLPATRRLIETRGDPVSRSDTVNSHRSRGGNAARTSAEDFLGTLDAHLDVEMARSEPSDARSPHLSLPVSRTNSSRGPGARITHRTLLNHAEEGEPRRLSESSTVIRHLQGSQVNDRRDEYPGPAELADENGPPAMERQRSRVIEFDRQGNPVSGDGQVYQETSPPRGNLYRQYFNELGRPVDPAPSAYGRDSGNTNHEASAMDYLEGQHSRHLYGPPQYGFAPTYRTERIVDPVTGQVYIVESPGLQTYDDTRGPQTLYDDMGRPVRYEYREIDYDVHRVEGLRYERQPPGYQDRRYQGR